MVKSKLSKGLHVIHLWTAAFCLSIVIFTLPVIILSKVDAYYFDAFDRYGVYKNFVVEGAQNYFYQILNYIAPPFTAQIDNSFFSYEDIAHMNDVRTIFISIYFILLICILIIISRLITGGKIFQDIYTNSRKIIAVTLSITSVVTIFAFLNWGKFFIVFHSIIFPFNDFWLLDPSTSNLIKFLPEQIFKELGILYLFTLTLEILLLEYIRFKFVVMSSKQPRFLFTGGHMTPALAVISELEKRNYNNFIWVGAKFNQSGTKEPSAEYKTLTNNGIKFININTGKLSRDWKSRPVKAFLNLAMIPIGFLKTVWILIAHRPKVIVSFGGYIALPIVIVGRLVGIKSVTHEQTTVAGLANRIIGRFVNKVFISWSTSAKYYPSNKVSMVGNPIRPEISRIESSVFNFDNNLPIVYITGGNQGSHIINKTVMDILPELLKVTNVIHQTGSSTVTRDYKIALEHKDKLSPEYGSRYIVRDYIYSNEIGEVMDKAKLIISRAGANTCYEILALGIPSILIPIPWSSHNEQMINAMTVAETGLAKIIEEKDISPKILANEVTKALDMILSGNSFSKKSLEDAQLEAQKIIVPDAAVKIVDSIIKLIS